MKAFHSQWRQLIFSAAIMAMVVSSVFSQEGSESDLDKWIRVTTATFSVEIPKHTKKDFDESNGDDGDGIYYSTILDGTRIYIFEEPAVPTDSRFLKMLDGFLKENGSEIVDDREVYVLRDDEGFFHNILVHRMPGTTQIFRTISELRKDTNARHFFKTLMLKGEPFRIKELEENVELPDDSKTESSNPLKELAVDTDLPDRRFKILSVPQAEYSNAAKEYMIVGVVRLRVTFGNDETVWRVEPETKLPFGLTKAAIRSAMAIQFEPAVKDGKLVTQTRPMEYIFTLF